MRGTGAALEVEHMISDVRASAYKFTPICPYVFAQYKKHPEQSDGITSALSAA